MRYSLLTSPENFVDEIDLIERLFDSGLDFLYIRKPHLKDLALERFLLALSEDIRKRSFFCGSPNVAENFGILGFHAPVKWILQNADAVSRAGGLLSVGANELSDIQEIPEPLLSRVAHIVVPFREGSLSENVLVESDATDLAAGVENVLVVSGIWEFADPVSAWRRLCKK